MSNLGDYQAFTTAAKEAGGVAPYLHDLEVGVARKFGLVGFGAGVVATLGFAFVMAEVDKRRTRRILQEQERQRGITGYTS